MEKKKERKNRKEKEEVGGEDLPEGVCLMSVW